MLPIDEVMIMACVFPILLFLCGPLHDNIVKACFCGKFFEQEETEETEQENLCSLCSLLFNSFWLRPEAALRSLRRHRLF